VTDTGSVSSIYPQRMLADLGASGLTPADVRAKVAGPAEKSASGMPSGFDGYTFPYFDIEGKPLPFYRVKIFDAPDNAKYRQIADSQNHVYFPPRLSDLLPKAKYLIVTEGEKKAAACVKQGFPAIAFGGVDSWKSRNIVLPAGSTLAQKPKGSLGVRLPSGGLVGETIDTVAKGFAEFIEFVIRQRIPIIICYDTDDPHKWQGTWKPEVQRAAAVLGFELRFRGVPIQNIRCMVLDHLGSGTKTALDDVLQQTNGADTLRDQIDRCLKARSAFPRHPNIRDYVNKKLQRTQLTRQEQQAVSMAVLSDLDARGQRLRSPDAEELYYFMQESKSLSRVIFTGKPDFAELPFGRLLYKEYGLGFNDNRVLGWLATQYSAEDPVSEVYPKRVLGWEGDTLYYQINDGTLAKVTKDAIELLDNGSDGMLFEAGLTKGLETEDFGQALNVALVANQPTMTNWWSDVLKESRVAVGDETGGDTHRRLLALLYYVSPFFYRWRGTQLPVEITTGEAGSGKSTLYELRLDILTGIPKLRNAPSDLKDWNASLASSGGLHVSDNMQLLNADLRQRLSDEICRLVTEPNPSIEQRKLYTDTTIVKIPVQSVFAMTAIRQPFQNVDIIQRSIITSLDKGTDVNLRYDAQWEKHQLERFGGRAQWLIHHLIFVQHMLKLIHTEWDTRYQARYRLINVEQLLMVAAKVSGWDHDWIPKYLESSRDSRLSETDWALEGLVAFADHAKSRNIGTWSTFKFDASRMSDWLSDQEEFKECQLLQSARTLGRYIQQHKHTVATTAHIVQCGLRQNKVLYRIRTEAEETKK
jgi:hypothetical protein